METGMRCLIFYFFLQGGGFVGGLYSLDTHALGIGQIWIPAEAQCVQILARGAWQRPKNWGLIVGEKCDAFNLAQWRRSLNLQRCVGKSQQGGKSINRNSCFFPFPFWTMNFNVSDWIEYTEKYWFFQQLAFRTNCILKRFARSWISYFPSALRHPRWTHAHDGTVLGFWVFLPVFCREPSGWRRKLAEEQQNGNDESNKEMKTVRAGKWLHETKPLGLPGTRWKIFRRFFFSFLKLYWK